MTKMFMDAIEGSDDSDDDYLYEILEGKARGENGREGKRRRSGGEGRQKLGEERMGSRRRSRREGGRKGSDEGKA